MRPLAPEEQERTEGKDPHQTAHACRPGLLYCEGSRLEKQPGGIEDHTAYQFRRMTLRAASKAHSASSVE